MFLKVQGRFGCHLVFRCATVVQLRTVVNLRVMEPRSMLRAGWARREVLSDCEHDLVNSAADSLRGLERANKDMANMTREGLGGYNCLTLDVACVSLACVTLQVN